MKGCVCGMLHCGICGNQVDETAALIARAEAAEKRAGELEAQLAAAVERVRELERRAVKVRKEMRLPWPVSPECAHAEFEPDTCLEIMRCEKCGMPAHLATLLNELAPLAADRGE